VSGASRRRRVARGGFCRASEGELKHQKGCGCRRNVRQLWIFIWAIEGRKRPFDGGCSGGGGGGGEVAQLVVVWCG
jgi:hypothetical protein